MQFKYPELLYALFLLAIPIIIHLFQLRKFKVEPFTNVALLKSIKLNSRKSNRLKKWLVLTARLLFLGCIIFAFAQPFFSKQENQFKTKETVIYLDNSFSMTAKGKNGALYNSALQDLILKFPENESISLFTNDKVYKNTTFSIIKNELLKDKLTANQLSYKASLLKAKSLFSSDETSAKRFVYISDFQQNSPLELKDSINFELNLVKLEPENSANSFIDSVYISKAGINTKELTVKIESSNFENEDLTIPVSLYNNDKLVTKSSTKTNENNLITFSLPNTTNFDGKIVINDNQLEFDNQYFFNISTPELIRVLEIKSIASNPFLKRIYTSDEFEFQSFELNQLDYSLINNQNTIIINAIKTIPSSLISALSEFKNNGGTLIFIPKSEGDLVSYNAFLSTNNLGVFNATIDSKKSITTINYEHPIFANNVFEKRVKNFQYPTVNNYLENSLINASNILSFENGSPFLASKNNIYMFTSSLNSSNSNFTQNNLIVPTFYNMALLSLPPQKIGYTIGKEHNISIASDIQNDGVILLKGKDIDFIPLQEKQNNTTIITTTDIPNISGHYKANYNNTNLQTVSYNYNKEESKLSYHNLNELKNVSDNLSEVIDNMQSAYKINELWKWFVIFALLFLGIEMLLLKFLK